MNEKTSLHQHGTLGALMAGLMDGTAPLKEILTWGDFGIGTLHGLDGEMIILAGQPYQGRADGSLVHLTGAEMVPYAAVTTFKPEQSLPINDGANHQAVKQFIEAHLQSKNIFSAVKLSGCFKKMHIRIMPKQERPYDRLVNVSKNQPEFIREDVEGTIVGFYTPELFQGAAAAGFHLHFLADDHQFGGHILGFELESGTLELAAMDQFIQHFPTSNAEFMDNEIDYTDLANEIAAAEG
ncbi:acetolactate decarboxylase [Enterococcus faecalis]